MHVPPVSSLVYVMSQWMLTHLLLSKTVSPLGEQSCTVSALQVSWGVSWPLFIIRVLCTRRQSWPSVTTLCKWVKEMNIKPCPAGTFGVWGFSGKLCPSSSSGATLKLLLV